MEDGAEYVEGQQEAIAKGDQARAVESMLLGRTSQYTEIIIGHIVSGCRAGTLDEKDLWQAAGKLIAMDDLVNLLDLDVAKGIIAREQEYGTDG